MLLMWWLWCSCALCVGHCGLCAGGMGGGQGASRSVLNGDGGDVVVFWMCVVV